MRLFNYRSSRWSGRTGCTISNSNWWWHNASIDHLLLNQGIFDWLNDDGKIRFLEQKLNTLNRCLEKIRQMIKHQDHCHICKIFSHNCHNCCHCKLFHCKAMFKLELILPQTSQQLAHQYNLHSAVIILPWTYLLVGYSLSKEIIIMNSLGLYYSVPHSSRHSLSIK